MAELVEGLSFEEYSKTLALSSTMVSGRHRLSWAHALMGRTDSATLKLGRAHHTATMQPKEWAEKYSLMPSAEGIKNKDGSVSKNPEMTDQYKKIVAGFREANPTVELLSAQDMAKIQLMCKSAHEAGREHLGEGVAEASIFFTVNGVSCKSRPDFIPARSRTVVEIKTTRCAEPRTFSRDVRKWGYGIQMAFQGIAIKEALGWTPEKYIILATESKPPYCSSLHRLSNAWIAELEELCIEYIDEYKKLDMRSPTGYPTGINIIDFSTGESE